MGFDFASAKQQMRRVVHDTLAVSAVYAPPSPAEWTTELRVRWHNKIQRFGDQTDGYSNYAEVIEGINRVVFDAAELLVKDIKLQRGATLTLQTPEGKTIVLSLDTQEPVVGPIEEIWLVTYP